MHPWLYRYDLPAALLLSSYLFIEILIFILRLLHIALSQNNHFI